MANTVIEAVDLYRFLTKKGRKEIMKKVIICMLSLLLVFGLFACGSADNKGNETANKLNVVLVVPNSLGDKAFSDMIWNGISIANKQYGLGKTKCIELQGDTSAPLPTLTELCESKEWDIIVTGTFSLKESIQTVANKFPDQKFIIYDMNLDFSNGQFPNCASFAAMQNEGSFLAGALAAYMSKTGVVGFIGGKETTSVSDFLVGYIEGAKYVNPDIKVRSSFIGSFTDTATAKELALAQNAQSADVIFAVCSGAGLGVYEAASEKGFWAIGVDSDQSLILADTKPEVAKAILTSVVKHFDTILSNALGEVIGGTFEWGKHTSVNLAADGIGLANNDYYTAAVSSDIRTKVDDIGKKIISGEIKVSSAIGMDADTYKALKASAE